MKVIVLGAGRVGEAIVRDLAASGRFDLTVADVSHKTLDRLAAEGGLTTKEYTDLFSISSNLSSMNI